MPIQSLSPNCGRAATTIRLGLRRPPEWLRKWTGGVVLAVGAILLYIPGLFVLPPIDRDEARFAEASRQMASADDWRAYIVPQVAGEPRLNKPPLIYWLQAAVVKTLGVPAAATAETGHFGGIWAYRLPSVLGAVAATLVTWRIGLSMFAGPTGPFAALLLAISAVVMFDVRQARADQVLLACTALAQWGLWSIWRRREAAAGHAGWALLLWVAVGLGVLAKGPLTPMIVGLAAFTLSAVTRDWRWLWRLRPAWGLPLAALIVMPWVVLVGMQVGWGELAGVIWAETFGRGMTAQEGHFGPPGYYVLLLPVLFWPGSLALAPGLWRGMRRAVPWRPDGAPAASGRLARWRRWWQTRRVGTTPELFCLAWLLPSWLVFELAMTKLPHYVLPLFPALALLCARGVFAGAYWQAILVRPAGRAALWAWTGLSVAAAVALPTAAAVLLGKGTLLWSTPVAGALLVTVVLALLLIRCVGRRQIVVAQFAAFGLATVLHINTFQFVLPNLDPLWLSVRMTERIDRIDPDRQRPLAAAGYHEESLIFLRRGRIERLDWWELADWLGQHPTGLAVVAEGPLQLTDVATLAEVSGYNYSNGHWQSLLLVEPTPGQARAAP